MKEQLHYKSERSLTFENVLTKCQKIYNIYETHGEEMSEEAKIRFLFKKIGHEGLSKKIEAMKTKIATEAVGAVTYTTVANHMLIAVSELPPDCLIRNRNVSAVGQVNGGGNKNDPGPHHGIFNTDGPIHTVHHLNQQTGMDPADKKKVNDKRARLGLGRHNKKLNFKPNQCRHNANNHNQLTQLNAANVKYKRIIDSLKSSGSDDVPSEQDVEISDAGNSFGGKSKRAKS